MVESIKVFGIVFTLGSFTNSIERLNKGGLMVVPSSPGLETIDKDLRYIEAVQNADFVISDIIT